MHVSKMAPSAANTIFLETQDLRRELLNHSIYASIQNQAQLQLFMSHHVFAVLDFMWLLKRLQRELCGSHHPWTPPAVSELSRFINEIVLAEESDEDGAGGFCSHFELYLRAMHDVAAPSDGIHSFIAHLQTGHSIEVAFQAVNAPESVRLFVLSNNELAINATSAQVAAAFCFGREDVIPDMFQRLLNGFQNAGMEFPGLEHYIRRHIELDGDHHGPLAHALVNQMCEHSADTLEAVITTARQALRNRIALWDGVVSQLTSPFVATSA